MLGPLYGAGVAALIGWRGIFWINMPLAVVAIVAVRRSLPATPRRTEQVQVDLGRRADSGRQPRAGDRRAVQPGPREAVLPSWGVPTLIAAALGLIAFVLWEKRSPNRLLDPSGLAGQTLHRGDGVQLPVGYRPDGDAGRHPAARPDPARQEDTLGGALILSRFLVALAIGAVAGGFLTSKVGERAGGGGRLSDRRGCLLAGVRLAGGHSTVRYPLGIPRMAFDLVLAGFGLGIVIAPSLRWRFDPPRPPSTGSSRRAWWSPG